MVNKFEKFNLDKNIIKSLNNMKYEEPSKVQDEVIPFLLNKNDIIVKSKTGSGKTASFAIPIVEKIEEDSKEKDKYKIVGKISKTNITKLFVKLGESN